MAITILVGIGTLAISAVVAGFGIRRTTMRIRALSRIRRRQTVAVATMGITSLKRRACRRTVGRIGVEPRAVATAGTVKRKDTFDKEAAVYPSLFLCLKVEISRILLGMERLRRAYRYAKQKYELLHVKKYTTIAGTLVFFLIMSIMPFAFWLTLIIGKLPIDTEKLFSLPVFISVKNVLEYVQKEAMEATAGASVVLLVTTLYSSTNLFYQMRRSGEIVYDVHRNKQGLRTRFAALILLVCVLVIAVVFLFVYALGSFLFSRLFSRWVELLIDHVLLAGLAFLLALLLNVYVCPYKRKLRVFLSGTCVTVALWAVAALGFSLYLKISNVNKLYGALSTVIVFLLWLYVMMIGFIVGVIFNSEKVVKKRKNKKA